MDEFNLEPLIAEINGVLFDTLRRVNLGNSRVARSVKIKLDKDSNFKIVFSDYVIFIDKGRLPRKTPPPIQPILDWMRRKGITPTHISELQLAYAISRSIGIKGIKPKPFLDRLHEEVTALFEIHIFEEVNRILSESLN